MIAAGTIRVAVMPGRQRERDAYARKEAARKQPRAVRYNQLYSKFRREHGRKPDAKELAEIGRRSWIVNDAKIHARDAKVHSHSPGPTAG